MRVFCCNGMQCDGQMIEIKTDMRNENEIKLYEVALTGMEG